MEYQYRHIMEYRHENIEMAIYAFVCLLVPFFLSQHQLFVGTIVNASLYLAAMRLKLWKSLPIIILPSIAAYASGFVFGNLSAFLIYLIPFIWMGNFVLVLSFRKLRFGEAGNLVSSSVLKALFLFTAAFILVKIGIIPSAFLIPMGVLQLVTALSGGLAAFGAQFALKSIRIN